MIKIFMVTVAIFLSMVNTGMAQDAGKTSPEIIAKMGGELFKENCATCHGNPETKAASVEALAMMSRPAIVQTLTFGRMQPQAAHLKMKERMLIAAYLSISDPQSNAWIKGAYCSPDKQKIDLTPISANWGQGAHNQRHQSKAAAGVDQKSVGKLKFQWAFSFPKIGQARSQPVLTADTLFVGSKGGRVYALNRATGCIKWHRDVDMSVRSGLSLGKATKDGETLLFFADSLASVYALKASNGTPVWKTNVKIHPTAIVTGSPSLHKGKLYVPISTFESAAAALPSYPCCTAHGAVVALNAVNGEKVWTTHTIGAPKPQGKNSAGTPIFGPSGASVWSTPAIDAKRNRLYVGTGNNSSPPATKTSDSILAMNLDTGAIEWSIQSLENDVWNAGCWLTMTNCPKDQGPDLDFGASVIIATLADGQEVLFAGQKSGEVYALDPDKEGAVIWRTRISQGTSNGGVHWGMTYDGERLYVPINDPDRPKRLEYAPRPGLYALDPASGQILWAKSATRGCVLDEKLRPLPGLAADAPGTKKLPTWPDCSPYYGLSAAATSTSDLVFQGSLDGTLRAYASNSGKVLWETQTKRSFDGVNGIKGHGGAIDVDGALVSNGWVYIQSGYSATGQMPGNVLLAFKVER